MSKPVLTLPLLLFLIISSVVGATQLSIGNSASITSPLQYIVTILMENHPLNTTLNPNGVINNPNATYITSLAKNSSLAENYIDTSNGGSLPQYIGLTSGNSSFVSMNCAPTTCQVNKLNIADTIERSGRTWKAYMEDLPPAAPCNYNGSGASSFYSSQHNPFAYYADIQNNATRCAAHIVPANSGQNGLPDDLFINDLNNLNAASNYMWLTPNNCDDMHGNATCPSSTITTADNYTRQLVPQILNSAVFKTGKAALFIVWDEPTFTCSTSPCPIPAIWVGPPIKRHYVSNKRYNHYSYLATIESLWGLPHLTSNDATAPSMNEFLSEFFGTPPPPPHCGVGNYVLWSASQPTGWNTSQIAPSIDNIDSSGVFHSKVVNTGSSFNGSSFAIAQQGGTPGPIPTGPNIPLPNGLFSTQMIYDNVSTSSTTNQIKVYVGYYFWFSQAKTTPLGTSHFLDTQLRFASVNNNVYVAAGTASTSWLVDTSNPAQSRFSYREVTATVQPMANYTLLNFNVTAYYARALTALGIPNVGPMNLTRIETGAEGFGVNYVNTEWCFVHLGPGFSFAVNPYSWIGHVIHMAVVQTFRARHEGLTLIALDRIVTK